jgi:hypothetical protein
MVRQHVALVKQVCVLGFADIGATYFTSPFGKWLSEMGMLMPMRTLS